MEIIKKLWSDVLSSFKGLNLLLHLAAIGITYVLVSTNFDWYYFIHTRNQILIYLLLPAAILGFFVPILAPVILFSAGKIKNSAKYLYSAYALAESAGLAWLISSAYKALTGRAHPSLFFLETPINNITKIFHFGFFKNGIFWGWPSSHATVAFAIAVTLIILFQKNLKIKIISLVFAFYVGFGVSVTIHWFSDFLAGALIGTAIGQAVGKSFKLD